MASRLLTTDDVEPGVAEMTPMIYIELAFAEGTKLMALFEPISIGHLPLLEATFPGQVFSPEGEIAFFEDGPSVTLDVTNTGDRDIQVRSHTHFFETNRALDFDRSASWGMKLDRPAGMGIRFEPGVPQSVRLIPIAGNRIVQGQAGLVNGSLDTTGAKAAGLELARARGYKGA